MLTHRFIYNIICLFSELRLSLSAVSLLHKHKKNGRRAPPSRGNGEEHAEARQRAGQLPEIRNAAATLESMTKDWRHQSTLSYNDFDPSTCMLYIFIFIFIYICIFLSGLLNHLDHSRFQQLETREMAETYYIIYKSMC
jgi:hypothetical protein